MTAPSQADPAPIVRFLADGDIAVCRDDGDSLHLWLMDRGWEARLTGRWADALRARLAGKAEGSSALTALERRHPWIAELSRAEASPGDPARLLLGEGLDLLFVELTERCNERCRHCYAEAEPHREGSLSLTEVEQLLREAARLGCTAVQFTGGDPLLHPQLVSAVAAARKIGLAEIEIYTNGLELSPSRLQALLPFAPAFAFSVYSHDAATHDAITRRPGSHGRTLAAIRRCLEAGLDVRIGVIVMPENAGQERQTRRFLQRELGLAGSRIGFDTVRETGRGRFFDYVVDDDPPAEDGDTGRRRGKLCVAADGTVYPCIFSRRTRLGNIRESSLTQIIRNLRNRRLPPPSPARWRRCQAGLSCADCQIIAYVLGEDEWHERQVA